MSQIVLDLYPVRAEHGIEAARVKYALTAPSRSVVSPSNRPLPPINVLRSSRVIVHHQRPRPIFQANPTQIC
jgi:hypothetical protein